jgi:adenylate cyclase class 2
MSMEIEAKMKVADLDSVRKTLSECGAERHGKVLETNTFFDTPARSLQSADSGLRIRVAVNEAGQSHCLITMKGPLQAGALKTREEIEFSADDPAAVQKLFERLGYQAGLSFQKRRESWTFQGCKVELDEMPLLGTYVEIEGPSESSVLAARQALGLSQLPPIKIGYVSMLARYLQENHLPERHIRF